MRGGLFVCTSKEANDRPWGELKSERERCASNGTPRGSCMHIVPMFRTVEYKTGYQHGISSPEFPNSLLITIKRNNITIACHSM